jgi:outer membrane murein-binding lipoprotein Lpp
VVAANQSIIAMYKAQIDAETAKIEYSRVQAQIFGEIVRAYVAQVEGWKAEWDAYKSKVEGQLAKVKLYSSQVEAFTARVQAFKADADAYASQVQGIAAEADAIAKINKANLDAWTAEVDGLLKIDAGNIDVFKVQWQSAVEQVKTNLEYWKAQNELQQRNRDREANLMIEERREALSDWQQRMQALLQAANGMATASGVAAQLAGSTMSGITSFAGKLVEEGGL